MDTLVGQTISHYAFLEKLGAGGMGEIYKARDTRLNRIVAVKVLAPGKTRDPGRRRRFVQEAQAASALNHPNIITIHDILPEGDTQYIVMEYVVGQTLHELIAGGRLPVPLILQLATQMANALAMAHAAGIIHRDFKPANVMVTGSGLIKILDFGLAKLTDPTRTGSTDQTADALTLTSAPLTVEGSIMGTVNYMSPEQAEGLKVDARSDIFSFGAVLYELTTGYRAFDGDSGISTLSAVLRDEVRPIPEIAADIPVELNEIIVRCLRKNPDQRWQSMAEVAAALNSLRNRLDAAPAPAEPAPPAAPTAHIANSAPQAEAKQNTRTSKVFFIASTCAAVLALSVLIAWWQTHRPPPTPQTPPQVAITVPSVPQPTAPPPQPDPEPVTPAPAPPPASRPTLPRPAKTKIEPPLPSPVTPQVVTAPVAPAPVTPPPRAVPVEALSLKLTDGLPFRIELVDDVPMDAEVGRALRFRVLDGLLSEGTVVVAKGSIVTGSIEALGKRNFFGGSKGRFRLISADAVNGSKINVRATPAAKSDGVETRPFETPNSSKDKNLIAMSGTLYVGYIAGDQTVNVRK